jgi:hypothetical protein
MMRKPYGTGAGRRLRNQDIPYSPPGRGSIVSAMKDIQKGVYNHLPKPFNPVQFNKNGLEKLVPLR